MSRIALRCLRDATLAFAALILAAAPIAAWVRMHHPGHVRRLLRFGFAGVPHQAAQMAAILRANLTVLVALLAMAALVQLAAACKTRLGRRAYISFCDLVVGLILAHDVELALGVSVGAYGARMLRTLVPAGPVELAAYALAASVYLCSRRVTISRREAPALLGIGVLSASVLIAAAVIETYV